jgi:uncharacterized protein
MSPLAVALPRSTLTLRSLFARLAAALALVVTLFAPSYASAAVELPPYEHWCTDLSGKLSKGERKELDERLRVFEEQTGHTIVVVIVSSLEDESPADLAYRIGKTWKIGRKGKDDGVVLLAALAEKRVRIEVGKGIEDKLTDLEANDIVTGPIRSARQGRDDRWYEAISAGVDAIEIKLAGKVYAADGSSQVRRADPRLEKKKVDATGIVASVLLIGVIVYLIVRARNGRGGGYGGGGGGFWIGGGGWGGGYGGGGGGGGSDGPVGGGGDFGGGGSDDSV